MTDEELEAMHERKRARTLARNKKSVRSVQFRRSFWILCAAFFVLIDQLSKWYVMEQVMRPYRMGTEGATFTDWITNATGIIPFSQIYVTSYFNLVLAWNKGVSFSMFGDIGEYGPLILIIVALIITGTFSLWLWNAEKHFHGICNALVIGGALGNVLDRIRFGAVIDFLDFHIGEHHWPAFNIADMCIVIGICLLVFVSLFVETSTRHRYRKQMSEKRHRQNRLRQRFKLDIKK